MASTTSKVLSPEVPEFEQDIMYAIVEDVEAEPQLAPQVAKRHLLRIQNPIPPEPSTGLKFPDFLIIPVNFLANYYGLYTLFCCANASGVAHHSNPRLAVKFHNNQTSPHQDTQKNLQDDRMPIRALRSDRRDKATGFTWDDDEKISTSVTLPCAPRRRRVRSYMAR
ncbi:hypothetical protein D9756_003656 [Leucocoprinus leucothites]|uniref:Uncharacterized protein n=1 Tax=Leucocoprinus leucothites TaxID=201217 RepID=A0A8H5LJI0_9AGAR|nr:hypothetical protein D9756_003656 [Leucoagaricus leucothites]